METGCRPIPPPSRCDRTAAQQLPAGAAPDVAATRSSQGEESSDHERYDLSWAFRQAEHRFDGFFQTARERREAATFVVDGYDEFKAKLEEPGGFLLAHWCGDAEVEKQIKEEKKIFPKLIISLYLPKISVIRTLNRVIFTT